jgi:D-sedoheptulose 7-phosphate isomerase
VKAIEHYADQGNTVILISSGGRSLNIIMAAWYAKEMDYQVITFTGHSDDNPLRDVGDLIYWVDSRAYSVIECVHQIWLLSVCDMLVGKAEYSV